MKVFEFVPEGVCDCKVTAWLHTEHEHREFIEMGTIRPLPAVIICPGGGYVHLSPREAEPVAQCYFAAGYHTFILHYAVGEEIGNFKPLCQLSATIAHVRKYADSWMVEKDKIAVSGFSAGGHLAASSGILFDKKEFLDVFQRDEHIRPDAMILSYPVITADEYAHVFSIEHVSGAKEGSPEYQWFGLDKHVSEKTPPAFIWHTVTDQVVPVENSLKLAEALSKAKVPFEMHIFPDGRHGMSVCTKAVGTEHVYNGRWMELSIRWLNRLFDFEE